MFAGVWVAVVLWDEDELSGEEDAVLAVLAGMKITDWSDLVEEKATLTEYCDEVEEDSVVIDGDDVVMGIVEEDGAVIEGDDVVLVRLGEHSWSMKHFFCLELWKKFVQFPHMAGLEFVLNFVKQ